MKTDESIHDGALPGRQGDAAIKPSGRGLQDTTIVSLLMPDQSQRSVSTLKLPQRIIINDQPGTGLLSRTSRS